MNFHSQPPASKETLALKRAVRMVYVSQERILCLHHHMFGWAPNPKGFGSAMRFFALYDPKALLGDGRVPLAVAIWMIQQVRPVRAEDIERIKSVARGETD